jgi:hypothetical protein
MTSGSSFWDKIDVEGWSRPDLEIGFEENGVLIDADSARAIIPDRTGWRECAVADECGALLLSNQLTGSTDRALGRPARHVESAAGGG